jgi:4,5-dihydroxyphthalate decarboxylase
LGKLKITLACGDYDRVGPLKDGRVQPEGVDLTFVPLEPEELFFRMVRYKEFDASELSLASYITSRAQGKEDFIAIPVFPSRMFRHSAIFVHAGAGIEKPEDLKGRRVGVGEYQMTAIVWVKGILSDDYGVKASDIHWFTGGQEQPGREERLALQLPPEIRLEPIPRDKTLSSMLEEGELDAVIAARTPSPFLKESPQVKRLFQDPVEVEKDYFQRTGTFPIMHTVALRKALYDSHPWLAVSLYKAFNEAQEVSWRGIRGAPAVRYKLAWLQHYLEQEEACLGKQAWANGAAHNRETVETLSRYIAEQGMAKEVPPFEELFASNTLDESKI